MQKSFIGKTLNAIIQEAHKGERKQLIDTIEELHGLRLSLAEATALRASLELVKTRNERALDLAYATIAAGVIKEADENGKPRFSNETARKNEISLRANTDKLLVSTQKAIDDARLKLIDHKEKEDLLWADIERERAREKLLLIDLAPEQWA